MRAADRVREHVRTPGLDDDPAADALDELRGLALGVRRADDRACDGEDAVEPARDDVAGEPAREPDDVDVRRRERLGERLARLVRQKADAVRPELSCERDELGVPRAAADDRDARGRRDRRAASTP